MPIHHDGIVCAVLAGWPSSRLNKKHPKPEGKSVVPKSQQYCIMSSSSSLTSLSPLLLLVHTWYCPSQASLRSQRENGKRGQTVRPERYHLAQRGVGRLLLKGLRTTSCTVDRIGEKKRCQFHLVMEAIRNRWTARSGWWHIAPMQWQGFSILFWEEFCWTCSPWKLLWRMELQGFSVDSLYVLSTHCMAKLTATISMTVKLVFLSLK